MNQVTLPQSDVVFASKADLAESGEPFAIVAVEDGSYNGQAQYNLTIILSDETEAVLTLGAGGSRDSHVKLIREALAANPSDSVGPFQLVTFSTRFGKPGYKLANAA